MVMRKIALLFLLLISSVLVAQDTPTVWGLKMGTNIETVEKFLKIKFGKNKVSRNGTIELLVSDVTLGGFAFDSAKFTFQNKHTEEGIYTYLSKVKFLDKIEYKNKDGAFYFLKLWKRRLSRKYENLGDSVDGMITMYKHGDSDCSIGLELSLEEDGDRTKFWLLSISYHEDIIDESNEY